MKLSMISGPGLAIAGLMLATITPAFAQSDEEIIVMGRYGRVPDNVQSLSQAVSYADLDLSTAGGKAELRHRVALTARYLCEKMGESDSSAPPVPSCRDAAVKDAMARVGTVEEGFAPRGTAWAPKSRWQAPYPADWTHRYP
ncbi:UrcA family protein [Sphingobium estronivorans]|uniref:UrcA family protein n=1 Tax=Sphingobium estronivorans TaxID=1577690 RepID=UPI00123B99A4|nr:UrcA family protein [Sphingobium estronivorans]